MREQETIFDLQKSREDCNFIIKNGELEYEAVSDIFDKALDIPYLGTVLKLGKVWLNYIDYRFVRKLGKFLSKEKEIPQDKLDKFIASLSDKDKKRISDYLTQLLYTAEEDIKAEFMGKVYIRRVYDEINDEIFLRLCSVINRSYVQDLFSLKEYLEVTEVQSYLTDNLIALGLLSDEGNIYEANNGDEDSTGWGPTKHSLNEIGIVLFQILNDLPIENKINRTQGPTVSFEPYSDEDIEEALKDL